MGIDEEVLLTDLYESSDQFHPPENSVYVAHFAGEERSDHSRRFLGRDDICYIDVVDEKQTDVTLSIDGGDPNVIQLRSRKALEDFWRLFSGRSVYLDITGFRHHVWIPMLRGALENCDDVNVVYVEPIDYRHSDNPTEGEIYDLSERTLGVKPIPGFASFSRADDFCFVPLIGFEGPRVAHLLEHVQPAAERIYPIVGVPGYRPEFPFSAYIGNRVPLRESQAWRRVQFADANCPFSAFYLLENLALKNTGRYFKVAPVGTKPHALGAVLFVMADPSTRELIYDHPVRKTKRTSGKARLLTYNISGFLL